MPLDFDKYAAKGNTFVRLVADELDAPRARSGRVICSVFHALRNLLSHEQSFQFLSHLPMVLKGVYVDGWKFNFNKDNNHHSNLHDFLDEVMKEDDELAIYDFGAYEKERVAVASVFRVLHSFISMDEMTHIMNILPKELKAFIEESITCKKSEEVAINYLRIF